MTVALLGVAWAAVVVGGATRARPAPARVTEFRVAAAPPRPSRRVARWPVVRIALAAVIPLPIVPAPLNVVTGVLSAAAMWLWPRWQRRRDVARRVARLEAQLPEVVDLLVLAVGAGLTVPLALDAVARHGGDLAGELGSAVAASRRGHRLADALDALPARAGEPVRPLVAVLVASERYGAPITAGLERLAAEVRATRRRRADEAARKVSVKLLFPLVLCILPAFALLTVAPLIASALRSLRL
ncbi:MAG TPA: type II secretion system F family protein [Acidimicrobiales bacterium]|nr:type II secretion system F family protein [Acidimicrobiales bacterium]